MGIRSDDACLGEIGARRTNMQKRQYFTIVYVVFTINTPVEMYDISSNNL